MPKPFSQYFNPFAIARHPGLAPEAKWAILASRASDASAIESQPVLRRPPDLARPIPVDDILAALKMLDGPPSEHGEALR